MKYFAGLLMALVFCVSFVLNSAFSMEIDYSDIYITPKADTEFFSGIVGGDAVGSYDWSIGNGVPYGSRTEDMVFSYFDGSQFIESMRITNEGNVEIGTTGTASKLNVSGDIDTDTLYKIGGKTVFSIDSTLLNTFVGESAGNTTATRWDNTFVGNSAGKAITSGFRNTFIGSQAGVKNTDGSENTFIGNDTGVENIGGRGNTFIGHMAGQFNTEGAANTFIGQGAGNENTEGIANTCMGQGAGRFCTTGGHNICIGGGALFSNVTGSNNTCVGYGAGVYSTGSDNVFLGYFAGRNETGDNKLYIANSETDTLIYGDFSTGNVGIGTTEPQGTLDVNGAIYQRGGQLYADYVFEDSYKLESIKAHTEYMWEHKHLAAIPKATVDKNGVEIVEVGAHRKGIVEELEKAHIYISKLNEENKAFEERLAKLEAQLNKLNIR